MLAIFNLGGGEIILILAIILILFGAGKLPPLKDPAQELGRAWKALFEDDEEEEDEDAASVHGQFSEIGQRPLQSAPGIP